MTHSIYRTLQSHVAALSFFLTIVPSTLGIRHSFFNLILNTKLFSIIAKVSYSTFIYHLYVIFMFYFNRKNDLYISNLELIMNYIANLVICTLVGCIVTLFVELPFGSILRIIEPGASSENRRISMSDKVNEETEALKA